MTEFREQQLVIILADISGYTRFMIANQLSAIHGQIVINTLIETLINEIDIPLVLQEIEGDAVFLYAAHPGSDEGWDGVLAQVRTKLLRFFDVFIEAAAVSAESTMCRCEICANASDLSLKIIVHSGSAVFHSIGARDQISGTDVILAHRLLKNSVPGNEYLLMSAAAHAALGRYMEINFIEGKEEYAEIGMVKTYVHPMSPEIREAYDAIYRRNAGELAVAAGKYVVWATLGGLRGMIDQIRNPTTNARLVSRVTFSAGLALLAPFFFIVGLALVPLRLLNRQRARSSQS